MKKLTLSQWGSIAEIVGMIAVVISLVFVGYEIRQNTNKAELDATEAVAEFVRKINALGNTTEKASLLRRGLTDFDRLTQDEKIVFDSRYSVLITDYATLTTYHAQGEIRDDYFYSVEKVLALHMLTSGAKTWWNFTKHLYAESVQQSIEDMQFKYVAEGSIEDMFQFEPPAQD